MPAFLFLYYEAANCKAHEVSLLLHSLAEQHSPQTLPARLVCVLRAYPREPLSFIPCTAHCRLLQALKQLEGGLAEERGCGLGSAALPLLRRALARGGAVALALQTLLAVFDAQRFSDPQADLSLEEVRCSDAPCLLRFMMGLQSLLALPSCLHSYLLCTLVP